MPWFVAMLLACTGPSDPGDSGDSGDVVVYPSLSGVLVDAEARTPVTDATVCADGGGLGGCATTDASGAFEIADLPAGTRTAFLVDHEDRPAQLVPYVVQDGDEDDAVVVPVLSRTFVSTFRAAGGGGESGLGDLVVRLMVGDPVDGSGAADGLIGVDVSDDALYFDGVDWAPAGDGSGTNITGIAGFVGLEPGARQVQTRRTPSCDAALFAWAGENETAFSVRVDADRVTFAVLGCAAR